MIVLDTCVLIQILKGDVDIVKKLTRIKSQMVISSISEMELYYGALNKSEQKMLTSFCSKFKVSHITPDISKQATTLIKQYTKSHSLDIPDSLIAATCLVHRYQLFTLNVKDFRYIDGLKLF